MISSKVLYEYFEGITELHPAIIWDLFGYKNWNDSMKENRDDTLSMFLGLFKGLYFRGVTYKEIYRCFLKNKLDDLIHIKYSINKSDYYREFCEKQIKIGNTFIIEKDEKEEVFIYSLIQPPYHFNHFDMQLDLEVEITENSLGDENEIILHKIDGYKRQDKSNGKNITIDYVTINDVKQLLFKQENKCYVCGDNVITESWSNKCLYQFTLDRINNKLPHNKNNVLI